MGIRNLLFLISELEDSDANVHLKTISRIFTLSEVRLSSSVSSLC